MKTEQERKLALEKMVREMDQIVLRSQAEQSEYDKKVIITCAVASAIVMLMTLALATILIARNLRNRLVANRFITVAFSRVNEHGVRVIVAAPVPWREVRQEFFNLGRPGGHARQLAESRSDVDRSVPFPV